MERGVAIFERRVFDLADPLQHEGHRGDAVAALEQRFDDQLKRLRRIELVDEQSPELHVARRRAGFVPGGKRTGNEIRRDFDFFADDAFDAADAGRGVFVPPGGESAERGARIRLRAWRRRARPLRSSARAQVEDLLDELDQVVDAEIVDRVFDRREQAEVAAEADDVPGVDQRAAFDAALQQLFDFGQSAGDAYRAGGRRSLDGRR